MPTALELFEQIRSNPTDDKPRLAVLDPGQACRQGDVYIQRLSALPANATRIQKPETQLAPGRTMGSRHCLDSLEGLTLYQPANASVLEGPVIEAKRDFQITHPEHGDRRFPAGVYRVGYQRAYADELRRVID